MFFEGTLQEGITSAVEQAKLVVCFVTDGQPESQKWETEFLTDENLREHLAKEAVVLKLQAGSTEAGYLAAIFPLPKTPTLVCIKNGELKEYIASGVSKEEFSNRLAKALGVTLKTWHRHLVKRRLLLNLPPLLYDLPLQYYPLLTRQPLLHQQPLRHKRPRLLLHHRPPHHHHQQHHRAPFPTRESNPS